MNQAYALRCIPKGSAKARTPCCLPSISFLGTDYSYNLSCYACQMKQLDAAWFVWRACVIGNEKEIKKMAPADLDLQPLWDEIRAGF